MGKHKQSVCPGCSRHCPLSHVRCKYGQNYIKKRQKAQETTSETAKKHDGKKRQYKWEKHVSQGNTAWKLLWTSSLLKRALRKGRISEQQIHLALSDGEQTQLCALLEKISTILE